MLYSNSYFSDCQYKSGDFVLSSVNSTQLKRYGINMKVQDFKSKVKRSQKYKIIITGGSYGRTRHTQVYNYYDFV